MGINVSVNGNIGTDITEGATDGGTKTAKFRVGANDRRYNSKDKEWEDSGSTSWVNVIAYGKNAEKVINGFKKRDAVKITGQLEVRDYEKDGKQHTIVEVTVASIENPFAKAEDPAAE